MHSGMDAIGSVMMASRAGNLSSAEEEGGLIPFVPPQQEMLESGAELRFTQLHVEVARNATGDFNPFHDPLRWRQVRNNRFGAPIVLGFQLEMLLAQGVAELHARERTAAPGFLQPYLTCRFTFADVVRVGEPVTMEVKSTSSNRRRGGTTGNRVLLRKQGRVVVSGRVEHQAEPPAGLHVDFRPPAELFDLPSGSRLAGGRYFLKHRALQASDAKNFLAGSQVTPSHYFDELEGKMEFPPLFPLSLISSALLEKAASEGYDFMENPLVYASHLFHVDLRLLRQARDGELLHLLVEGPLRRTRRKEHSRYRCVGLLSRGRLLFTAEIRLAALPA